MELHFKLRDCLSDLLSSLHKIKHLTDILQISFLAFAWSASFANACESNSGTLNRAGEFWAITHVFDPNGPVSTSDFIIDIQDDLAIWPCSEVLTTNDGLLVFTIGSLDATVAEQQINIWMNRPKNPLARNTQLVSGAIMSARFLNAKQINQMLNTYPATELIGFEALFASRDYQGLWVMRLDGDGQIVIRAMGDTFFEPRVGRYSIGDDLLLCTFFPSESCGRLEANGSGLLIRQFPEGQVHSDIFFWTEIGTLAQYRMRENLPLRSDVRLLVMGRTLKDREVWLSTLHPDGRFEFQTGRSETGRGTYRLVSDGVCYLFTSNKDEICRYAQRQQNGQIFWVRGDGTAPISEILGILSNDNVIRPDITLNEVPRITTVVPRETTPSTSLPSATNNPACRDIGSFCTKFVGQTTACGFVLQGASDGFSNSGDTGVVGGAASGAACTAMTSALYDIGVTPEDLALAAIGGAAGSAAMEAESIAELLFFGLVAGVSVVSSQQTCEKTLIAACY